MGLHFGRDGLLVHVQPSERGGFQVTLKTYHRPGAPVQQARGPQGEAELGGSAEIGTWLGTRKEPMLSGH